MSGRSRRDIQMNSVDGEEPLTVGEAFELIGVGKVQFLAVLATTLGLLHYLLDIIGAGMILPAATCELQMDTLKKGIFTSAPFVGLALTSHLWGFLTDWYGRQKIIVYSVWLALIFYVTAGLTPNYWAMVVLRLFSGMANAGSQSAMYPYVGEMLTNKTRSKLMIVIGFANAGTMFLMSGVGWLLELYGKPLYISESYSIAPWRQQILILGIPGLIAALLFCYLPESPQFLKSRGKTDEALKVLRDIHRKNCNGKDYFPIAFLSNEGDTNLAAEKSFLAAISSFLVGTKMLFRLPYLWPVLGFCLIRYGLHTVADAFAVWYPELMNRVGGGESELNFCQILATASESGPSVVDWDNCYVEVREKMFIDNMILGAAFFVANIMFYLINTKVKILYVVIMAMSAASLCCFILPSLNNGVAIVVSFTIFFIGGGASMNMVNVLLVEIFPVHICGMVLGMTMLVGRIATIIATNLIGTLLETDCDAVLYSTAGVVAAGVISVILLPKKIVKRGGEEQ